MTKPRAALRSGLASQDDISPLEYGLVAAFVAMALLAAIPDLTATLEHVPFARAHSTSSSPLFDEHLDPTKRFRLVG